MPSAVQEARLYFDQGKMSFERRDYDEAADYFRLAVERDPRFVEAHRYLAETYEKIGYTHRARKAWEALSRVTTDEAEQKEIKQRMDAL